MEVPKLYVSSEDGNCENERISINLGNVEIDPCHNVFSDYTNDCVRYLWRLLRLKSDDSVTMQKSCPMEFDQSQELQEEKRQKFWEFFILITSIIYGVALFMIGLVVYSTDLLFSGLYSGNKKSIYNFSDGFNIYLCLVGTIFLSGLIFDIYQYINTIERLSQNQEVVTFVEDIDRRMSMQVRSLRAEMKQDKERRRNINEYYVFSTGRHSGSFFLKVGASIFCFGHLVRVMLEFSKQIGFYISDDHQFCLNGETLSFKAIYAVFSFVQLYIIFRFGNVIVNRNKTLSRFAFIHCISSSLCFWLYSIINETMDALVEKYMMNVKGTSCSEDDHVRLPRAVGQFPICESDNSTEFSILNNIVCDMETRKSCTTGTDAIALFFYPFSIEFSILTVGVWYVMWDNIGKVEEHKGSMECVPGFSRSRCTSLEPGNVQQTRAKKDGDNANDTMVISANCANSNRGLFLGLGLLVITMASVIVHLVWQTSCDEILVDSARKLSHIIECINLFFMIVATIVTYVKIIQLDVNPHPVSFLDDLLLLICIPSYFILFFFSIGAHINQFMPLNFITDFLTIVQVTVQTPLIVDGLRRCSNTRQNQKELPGRNIVMFLIVCNLVNYIFFILMQKSSFYEFGKIEFYGSLQWSVISHITLPLCVFYRFHSSVALVDIWNSAYKPQEG